MFDFRNESDINRIIDVVTPILNRLKAGKVDAIMPNCYGMSYEELLVFEKTRHILLDRVFEKIGFDLPHKSYDSPDILCDDGYLFIKNGDELGEYMCESLYDCDFISPKGFFWADSWGLNGDYCELDDLYDYAFTEDLREYMSIDNLDEISFDDFKKNYAASYNELKTMWHKDYAEEMTKAFYPHLKELLEENEGDDMTLSYFTQVNVGVVPFLKALKKNPELRRDKASRFALLLIRAMRFPQSAFPCAMGNILYGFTDNLFFNTQCIGSGGAYYGSELYEQCLSTSAMLAMNLIDDILAYLDTKYEFLPHLVRQMYRHPNNEDSQR